MYVCMAYIGRNSPGAAWIGFRDCNWGNYKRPLPPHFTPAQRRAAVDGHRRDLLQAVLAIRPLALSTVGSRLNLPVRAATWRPTGSSAKDPYIDETQPDPKDPYIDETQPDPVRANSPIRAFSN